MGEFKTGDRVRLVNNGKRMLSAEFGAEAIVYRPAYRGPLLNIKWIRKDGRSHEQRDGEYYPDNFELVK